MKCKTATFLIFATHLIPNNEEQASGNLFGFTNLVFLFYFGATFFAAVFWIFFILKILFFTCFFAHLQFSCSRCTKTTFTG